jgi:hypothetical protein
MLHAWSSTPPQSVTTLRLESSGPEKYPINNPYDNVNKIAFIINAIHRAFALFHLFPPTMQNKTSSTHTTTKKIDENAMEDAARGRSFFHVPLLEDHEACEMGVVPIPSRYVTQRAYTHTTPQNSTWKTYSIQFIPTNWPLRIL